MKSCSFSVFRAGLIFVVAVQPMSVWAMTGQPEVRQSAPTRAKSLTPAEAVDASSMDSTSEYFRIVGQLEQLHSSGQKETLVSRRYFQSLTWIGRTACINYVCGLLPLSYCRQALELGLSDDALVVRDHALRITISTSHFTETEKRTASEKVISDQRNYRKGRPFWIVDRAREFLVAGADDSARR